MKVVGEADLTMIRAASRNSSLIPSSSFMACEKTVAGKLLALDSLSRVGESINWREDEYSQSLSSTLPVNLVEESVVLKRPVSVENETGW